MFSLTVLNLDTLSALAWKRDPSDVTPAGDRAVLPEAPMALAATPQQARQRSRRLAFILPGWGL